MYLLFALLLLVIPGVLAEAQLTVDVLRYEPIPAQPGQYVTVYIELENTGDEDAPRAAVRIEDQFPFSTVSQSQAQKIVGTLQTQESVVEEFRIRVDSSAVVGSNRLKVLFTEDYDSNQWQERQFTIDVRPNDASLTVQEVVATPSEVRPGETMQVDITLQNTADITLRNIGLKLDLVETRGTTFIEYPFIPTGSSAQKTLTKLNAGEVTTISFNLKADPTATPGYYLLPMTVDFFDETGTQTVQNEYAGLVISAVPELEVYFEESTIRPEDGRGDITLKFVNKGVNDLKFLDIELLETSGYNVLSTSRQYLGDLDSDDFRSETFTIETLQENPDLELSIKYRDENNKMYEATVATPLQYDRSPEEQQSPVGIIIAVVVVLLIGFWIWRRRKHRKKR